MGEAGAASRVRSPVAPACACFYLLGRVLLPELAPCGRLWLQSFVLPVLLNSNPSVLRLHVSLLRCTLAGMHTARLHHLGCGFCRSQDGI